jgi:hypothetical protein
MQGFGLIYRWYRRYSLTPDDAVAVLHGPAEVNFAPVTDALVDLRQTTRRAMRAGYITSEQRQHLDDVARRLNFRDRRLDRVISEAVAAADGNVVGAALTRSLVQQKRMDALLALAALRDGTYSQSLKFEAMPLTRVFASELEEAGWPSSD